MGERTAVQCSDRFVIYGIGLQAYGEPLRVYLLAEQSGTVCPLSHRPAWVRINLIFKIMGGSTQKLESTREQFIHPATAPQDCLPSIESHHTQMYPPHGRAATRSPSGAHIPDHGTSPLGTWTGRDCGLHGSPITGSPRSIWTACPCSSCRDAP